METETVQIVVKEIRNAGVIYPYVPVVRYSCIRFLPDELLMLQKYVNGGMLGPFHKESIDTEAHNALIHKELLQLTKDSTDTSKTYEASPLGKLAIEDLIKKNRLTKR